MTPHNISSQDSLLELATRCIESDNEHSRVMSQLVRLVRQMAVCGSPRQRQHVANDLRDAADEIESAPSPIPNKAT
jgi:hypothetical protein